MKPIIVCPYDRRGFSTLTAFWAHCREMHTTILDREADDETMRLLTKDLARRKSREEREQAS